jgi:tRNA(fMet)-specific endonuclease VapC
MPPPYLIDTDHCVAFLKPSHPGHLVVAQRIAATSAADLRICLFTTMELSEGPWHSQTAQGYHLARAALHNFLSWVPFQPPSPMSVEEFGRLRAQLRRQGQMIENMDLAIAATALAHSLTMVTHNTRHFSRIPGLILDDWMP